MAIINALKTGVWSDSTVWPSGVFPTATDDVHANGFNITIDQDIEVVSITTAAGGGGSAGGGFYLESDETRVIIADIIGGTTTVLYFNYTSNSICTITGDVSGGAASAIYQKAGVSNSCTITGDVFGGTTYAIYQYSGTSNSVTITGDVSGGTTYAIAQQAGVSNSITITGNVSDGSGATYGIYQYSGTSNSITITGDVSGGVLNSSWGIYQYSGTSNSVTITGDVSGGSGASAYGISQQSGASNSCTITGVLSSGSGASAHGMYRDDTSVDIVDTLQGATDNTTYSLYNNVADSEVYIKGMDLQTNLYTPYHGQVKFAPTLGYNIDVTTATGIASYLPEPAVCDFPAITDVRDDVVFGSGTYTGTCAVPPAGSVALGVPVDATTGSAGIYLDTAPVTLYNVTLQFYETDTTTQIPNVLSNAYAGSELKAQALANASGQATFYLDAGTYSIRSNKSSVIFSLDSITVTADETFIIYGTPVVIPAAPSAEQCTVYEYLFDQLSQTPLAATTATARIRVSTDIGGKTHTISSIDGTYSASTGLVYWTIVREASIVVDIPETGVNKSFTVPDAASVRVSDA